MTSANPLLAPWTAPFGAPPFAAIEAEHFRPAFEIGLAEERAEIAAIAGNPDAPSFANTIDALERSGRSLGRTYAVLRNLVRAHGSEALQAIERETAPILARHNSAIYLDEALFARIDDLFSRRESLGLATEQDRVLERHHTAFRRAGAGRPPEVKARLATISERLASLGTRFGQNLLADERSWRMVLNAAGDLAGLPDFLVKACAAAATARGESGYVVTLSRPLIEPFLQFSSRRDLRERAFAAWIARGERGGDTDNHRIVTETIALRSEYARLLGYESFAHLRLADSMAKTPQAAMDLLRSLWTPARAQALAEREALQALAAAEGDNIEIEAWDWRYYAEKRRQADFAVDEAQLKPYFQLDRMIEAAFDTAHRLFGLTFTQRSDVPVYHPDVRAFEVAGAAGEPVGLFYGDYFARESKRSGAWKSAFRNQEKLVGEVRPIIANTMNFQKPAPGEPALLSFEEARILFHEFGHALHSLLSDVTYPSIAGTSVVRDFVEFPSQLFEHWLERPEVLERFAVHYQTGAPMPRALLDRLLASRTFNQGFDTVEFVAAAMIDLEMHGITDTQGFDPGGFEKAILDAIGMPPATTPRHRPSHFRHVFAGNYAASYYSYLWSEVLDADGFDAFVEAGDIFDPATARRLRDFVLSAGNRQEADAAYRAFRGRDPDPSALLRKRSFKA